MPHQEPIKQSTDTLEEVLGKLPKVEASPKEVLELKPNKAADATSGPDPQISQTGYVEWKKPDGTTFVAPVSNSETYERKGYTKGAEQDIPDFVAYNAELAAKEPAAPKAAAKEKA